MIVAAIMALDFLADIAIDRFTTSLSKRLVSATIDAASEGLSSTVGNLGKAFFGMSVGAANKGAESLRIDAAGIEGQIKAAINEVMTETGLTLISKAELSALLSIASAADGQGNIDEALGAWKDIAKHRNDSAT
jgi:hypothetical protein